MKNIRNLYLMLAAAIVLTFAPPALALNAPCPIVNIFPPLVDAGGTLYTTSEFEIAEAHVLLKTGHELFVGNLSSTSLPLSRNWIALRVRIVEIKSGREFIIPVNLLKPH